MWGKAMRTLLAKLLNWIYNWGSTPESREADRRADPDDDGSTG